MQRLTRPDLAVPPPTPDMPLLPPALAEYASLTPEQMVDVVKQLQNVAYLLGLEEAKEMRRGKYLNILVRRRQQ